MAYVGLTLMLPVPPPPARALSEPAPRPPNPRQIKPDDWGFVPFDAAGNSEAVALKGVLWARFGALAVRQLAIGNFDIIWEPRHVLGPVLTCLSALHYITRAV